MRLSAERLAADVSATGFRPEILEKVAQLLELIRGLGSHPYLRDCWAVKGGTALNLFVFDVPRLSIDLDVNYIGAADREGMLAERPIVTEALDAVCRRAGLAVAHTSSDHAGERWLLRYPSAVTSRRQGDRGATLKLDVNFTSRVPLWPVTTTESRRVGSLPPAMAPLLDLHEVAVGKLPALLSRRASRDLFDTHQLLTSRQVSAQLDPDRLRLAFVVYGAMARRDWRMVSPEQIDFTPSELRNNLLPVLRTNSSYVQSRGLNWAGDMLRECRAALEIVLPFTSHERAFLDGVLDHGVIDASHLTGDAELASRIAAQPHLRWKASHARAHRAASGSRPNDQAT